MSPISYYFLYGYEIAKKIEHKGLFAHLINGCCMAGTGGYEQLTAESESLAKRLQTGDRQAAFELVDRYYQQIYMYMRRLGHDRQISEDLTQDSFLQAWQHIHDLKNSRALRSWLYHIAYNVSRLYWRKHKDDRVMEADTLNQRVSESNPVDQAQKAEDLQRLRSAVLKLPEKLRHVVVLHYLQHLTIAESADSIGIKEGTFKSRLNKALTMLRNKIE